MEILNILNPDVKALKEAYRNLPRRAEIMLNVPFSALEHALEAMEVAGFIGMKVMAFNPHDESENIIAFKGKSGPCYNTGRHALYLGSALAALDDDNHILFAGIKTPVCEKTANLYKLPVYDKLLKCSDADQKLLAKLDDNPEIFNCSTMEEDLDKLYNMLQSGIKANEFEYVFYPGPFRMLILNDGSIIKRGQINRIPKKEAGSLEKKDNIIKVRNSQVIPSACFQELYSLYGTKCLLNITAAGTISETSGQIELKKLNSISPELKSRLLNLIEKDKKFFILTGSDLNDKFGCCPSTEVTAANRLVEAGILDSWQQPAADDACPVTIYAFRNEIKSKSDNLQFKTNNEFRGIISGKLKNKNNRRMKLALRWVLLTFVFLSLAMAFIKLSGLLARNDNTALSYHLEPWNKDQYMVLLFHTTTRCDQCLRMEKYINEVLDESYKELVEGKKLQFKMIKMDHPDQRYLVETFDLYTASVVLVRFNDWQETNTIILRDSWKYTQDEAWFKDRINSKLKILLNKPYE